MVYSGEFQLTSLALYKSSIVRASFEYRVLNFRMSERCCVPGDKVDEKRFPVEQISIKRIRCRKFFSSLKKYNF